MVQVHESTHWKKYLRNGISVKLKTSENLTSTCIQIYRKYLLLNGMSKNMP